MMIFILLMPAALRHPGLTGRAAEAATTAPAGRFLSVRQFSSVTVTGTGLRMMSSTGDVFCT